MSVSLEDGVNIPVRLFPCDVMDSAPPVWRRRIVAPFGFQNAHLADCTSNLNSGLPALAGDIRYQPKYTNL